MFPTSYADIIKKLEVIDPVRYGFSRNYKHGAVTQLSPYISRGVLSTKQVLSYLRDQNYHLGQIEKFIQELAWRDYWQLLWVHHKTDINQDLKSPQVACNPGVPYSMIKAEMQIKALDQAVVDLYQTGYMHNHMRMYIASVACNVGQYGWKDPAKWMYYHLLDGDWASNALSWQWVAGTNSKRQYYANQENINKYFESSDKETFLDCSYNDLINMKVPEVLHQSKLLNLSTSLPATRYEPPKDTSKDLLIYNYYNLDPLWRRHQDAHRVFLLEPSVLKQYPIGQRPLSFALELAKNIKGLQVFVGSFKKLTKHLPETQVYFKEHPLNQHYKGRQDPRDWMFEVKGVYPSFFAFWKKCKPELYETFEHS